VPMSDTIKAFQYGPEYVPVDTHVMDTMKIHSDKVGQQAPATPSRSYTWAGSAHNAPHKDNSSCIA
jgi:hypothetical protein